MGRRVEAYAARDSRVALGANTRKELARLNGIAREMVLDRLYEAGVDIPIPDGVIVSAEAEIAPGARILPGTVIRGRCRIGAGCEIGPNSFLEDAVLGEGCVVRSSYVTGSLLGNRVTAGPFSHIRPGCSIGDRAKIGAFVEVKNSSVGKASSIAHLAYVGDTDCGGGVNIGCGAVTVNYNGAVKSRTVIGDGAFIGCNTNLVAPVTVGEGAYTAAGSTVTVDIPPGALCIARCRETIKPGRAARYRKDRG
jgi:bifunctional UDP-N-acetylglucosamine pyrophosphorylase/glucosamine-1-phosphate N-acetyltransferase